MKRLALIFSLIMAIIPILASCMAAEENDGISQATEDRYEQREIRDYNGTRLDPSIGPRDNSISGIQEVDISNYFLTIDGLADKPTALTYDDVLSMEPAERVITLYCVEGWEATVLWKGVRLSELIDLANPMDSADTVIFHCVDDYTTSMPISDIRERDLLLAYGSNGITLPPQLGFPFIVVAEDKLGYKWARWVVRIELSDDPNYKGYWETRGFDNEADLK